MPGPEAEALLGKATDAMSNALATYSGFSVGAALLGADGETYTGANVENPSLMMSECAERVALLKALSTGTRDFRAIAVFSSQRQYCFPCGSCRQMLYEFSPGVMVVLGGGEAGVRQYHLEELLPHAFNKDRPS